MPSLAGEVAVLPAGDVTDALLPAALLPAALLPDAGEMAEETFTMRRYRILPDDDICIGSQDLSTYQWCIITNTHRVDMFISQGASQMKCPTTGTHNPPFLVLA